MPFQLEQFVIDNYMARISPAGDIVTFGMENTTGVGSENNQGTRRLTSLFITLDYTKGAETDVTLVFDVGLKQYEHTRNFRILSNTNPCEPYVAKMTATGKYIIPLPLPSRTTQLLISALAGFTGNVLIGFTSDEGIISPRNSPRS